MFTSFFNKRKLKRLLEQHNNNNDIIEYAQDVLSFCNEVTFKPKGIRALRATKIETRYNTILDLSSKVDVYVELMRCGGDSISEMFNRLPDKKEMSLSSWFTEDGYSVDELTAILTLTNDLRMLIVEIDKFKAKDETLYIFYKTGAKSLIKELLQAILTLLSLNITQESWRENNAGYARGR